MIKYEVAKGSLELQHTHPSDWTVDDLKNYYEEEDKQEKYEYFIDSFETENEARKCFDKEKGRCKSFYDCNRRTLEFECLSIWKNEYDDKGDMIQGDTLDEYVSPIISNE